MEGNRPVVGIFGQAFLTFKAVLTDATIIEILVTKSNVRLKCPMFRYHFTETWHFDLHVPRSRFPIRMRILTLGPFFVFIDNKGIF